MNPFPSLGPTITRAIAIAVIAAIAIAAIPAGIAAQRAASTPVTTDPCLVPPATPDGAMNMPMGTPDMSGGAAHRGATPAAMPPFDLAFIDMMEPHHEGAILMSQVALVRAEHPEIKHLAREIITAQKQEQRQMEAWRAAWYPDAQRYGMAAMMAVFDQQMADMGTTGDAGQMGHMDPTADVAKLCAANGPFDLAFMTMMISHHEAAVMMAEVALRAAQHPELKSFARQVIDAQTAEIEQMRGWIAAWYPSATPAS